MQHPACDLTDDRSRLAEADVVAFHMPLLRLDDTPLEYPGQIWLSWSMESDSYYPKQADPHFLRHFDLIACHRQDCDLRMPSYLNESSSACGLSPNPSLTALLLSSRTIMTGQAAVTSSAFRCPTPALIPTAGHRAINRGCPATR